MKVNCTSLEFKTDISQLCTECPLIDRINKGLEEQILFQALEQKEILNQKQFKAYIDNEIGVHQKAKQRVFLTEKQNKDYKNDPHRAKRIELYIWNKECIRALNHLSTQNALVTKLSMTKIALLHVYNKDSITKSNCKEKALEYGHSSGHKLYQVFNFYYKVSNRKGDEGSKVKNINKIENIESIIELLLPSNKQRALDEIKILKSILKNEY